MKNVLFILFQKKLYEVKLQRFDYINHQPAVLDSKVHVTKYNKTQSVLTGTFNVVQPMNLSEFEFTFRSFQNIQNQQVESLITIPKENACKLIKSDKLLFPGILQHSNVTVNDCIVKAGTYSIDNYYVQPNDYWPNDLVGDKWKFHVTFWKDNKLRIEFNIYVDIDKTEMIKNKLGAKIDPTSVLG